jgi:cytoskeletal protein CcmA (bactofilin family)
MKTETTVKQNIKINGSGTAGGGKFDEVKINGSGKVVGDVECNCLKIDGSGKIEGSVNAESIKINGSGAIEGDIIVTDMKINGSSSLLGNVNVNALVVNGSSSFKKDAKVQDFEINGSAKVNGRVTGGVVIVNGLLKVKQSCEVERFRSRGAIEIEELLSADNIELNIGYYSTAKEIGGEKIIVKRYSSNNIIKQIISFFKQSTDVLEAEVIEGDELDLEVTKAKLVRGKNIIVGEKCEIARIEYTDSLEIHPNAKVKETIKI